MEEFLQTLQEEFRAALQKSQGSVLRHYRFTEAKNIAKIAIGMRRSAKTYFLFQAIRELLAQKIPIEHLLYLNFEDDRLLPIDQKKMGELIDPLYTQQPSLHDRRCFLFLDEVQNVEG